MTRISWKGNTPVSEAFDDVYFSAENGVAETEHVFLAGNRLPQRFSGREEFTIAELGFGTGLNFLVALQKWNEVNPKGRLNFISCERFPIKISDMEKFAEDCTCNLPYMDNLLEFWRKKFPEAEIGPEAGWLAGDIGPCRLHLYVGDVRQMLETLPHKADAWFLDGFAPAKNPEMWGENIYGAMARQSNPGATFATYTAAGHVRRGLEAAGFKVQKQRGFGHKRDMTVGHLCDKLKAEITNK